MSREKRNRWFVQAGPCVNVDSVGDIFCRFGLARRGMQRLVLSCRCKEQTAIGGKGETPKERSERFVVVDGSVPDTQSANAAYARRIRHHGW